MKRKGLLLVLATAIISGFSIFINGWAVKGFDSSVFTFTKNLTVAVLLSAVILAVGKRRELASLSRRQWAQLAGIGFVGGSVPFLLFFKGLQLTSGTAGAFIHKTLFVWASVLAILTLKERVGKAWMLGASALLAGNLLLLKPWESSLGLGHLLIVVATIFWASENVWAKHVTKDVSGTVVAWARMALGSVFLFAYLAVAGKASIVWSMSSAQYAWIGVTSAFLLGYVLTYYNGLARVKVSTATAVLALGSPITLALNAAFKGAAIGAFQAAGMALILVGVAAILWFSELRFSLPTVVPDGRD